LQRQQLPQVVVDDALLEAVLGPARFEGHCSSERVVAPGTAAGLVWTAVGGKVQYIECICVGAAPAGSGGSRAGGHLTLTGACVRMCADCGLHAKLVVAGDYVLVHASLFEFLQVK
jgi:ATP-dependent Lon protease